jgi:hypothetical protein
MSTPAPITVNYRDHVITYSITDNTWNCDAFANHRGSPSLLLAQGRIDKLLDQPESKPKFERITAWKKGGWSKRWEKITITSKTEDGCFATLGGERCKLRSYDMGKVFADTPENVNLIEEIKAMEKEREELSEKIVLTTDRLENVKL